VPTVIVMPPGSLVSAKIGILHQLDIALMRAANYDDVAFTQILSRMNKAHGLLQFSNRGSRQPIFTKFSRLGSGSAPMLDGRVSVDPRQSPFVLMKLLQMDLRIQSESIYSSSEYRSKAVVLLSPSVGSLGFWPPNILNSPASTPPHLC